MHHHGWIQRCLIVNAFHGKKERMAVILPDLYSQFFIGDLERLCDDQRTQRHAKWLGSRSKAC